MKSQRGSDPIHHFSLRIDLFARPALSVSSEALGRLGVETMDSVFALVGDGFVLMAADASAARSILVFKHDEDKV